MPNPHLLRYGAAALPRRHSLALSISSLLLGATLSAQASAQPFPSNLNLDSLDGGNGYRLDGVAADDNAGASVSAAGDINGDGIDDLIIGAPHADPNGSESGSSYVVFGQTTPVAAPIALGSLDGSNGFRLDGAAANDNSGDSVSAIGDINGDGIDDLIIGAPNADPKGNFVGNAYVVFGRSTPFPATLALGILDGSNGFRLEGESMPDSTGYSVSAGDVNGDSIDDLIVGAPGAVFNGGYSGSTYVVFGRATPFAASIPLGSLDGSNGFRLDGPGAGDFAGTSVSAGDINDDGIDDLMIGASGSDPNGSLSGSSYVVFGRGTPIAATFQLGSVDGNNGFRLDGAAAGDFAGFSVSAAGDINSDGVVDLIVSAPLADLNGSRSGGSYVVFGRTTPFAATIALSSLDGSNGFRIDGAAANDDAGRSVSAADDFNGDGIDDLVVGAEYADPNGSRSGSSYVVFGRETPFPAVIALGTLNASSGLRLDGVTANDYSGSSVSSAGDVNGDGFDDLIIGAPKADPGGSESGSSYVVFGRDAVTIFRNGFE